MASFFQPSQFNDPAVDLNCTAGWQVYCNSIVPSSALLSSSYQYVTLILACVGVGIPVLFSVTQQLLYAWRKQQPKSRQHLKKPNNKKKTGDLRGIPGQDLPSSVQSFHTFQKNVAASNTWNLTLAYDLNIVPVCFSIEGSEHEGTPLVSSLQVEGVPASKIVLGLIDLQSFGLCESKASVIAIAKYVTKVFTETAMAGFVLETSGLSMIEATTVMNLLDQLKIERIPVLIKSSHDADFLDRVILNDLAGIIIENVCIHPNGERRDYYHSQRLRDLMAKCVELRVERPKFFVGFHDLWHSQPSAAVVIRAKKIATHFNAILEHGPLDHSKWPASNKMPISMSGFQYLRRAETSEVQRVWMQRKRDVHVESNDRSQSPTEQVASLPFGELLTLIPNIDKLLLPMSLPEDLQALRICRPSTTSPPEYVPLAPQRIDFWDFSADGEQTSFYGCVPLIAGGSVKQYEAVLETQSHLRELKMLQKLDDAEMNKMIEKLQQFKLKSLFPQLVESLIDGMADQLVTIYRGLGSGFTIPDHPGHFWGLSVSSDNSKDNIEIFISRRCPDDLSTILHTWLAHHGVARVQRFEEELRLENTTNTSDPALVSLPISIRDQIQNSTPAEALFLLQQLRVAKLEHPFKHAIEEYVQQVLVDETSAAAWNEAHSKSFLDGSAKIESLLERRLIYFVRLGAVRLPALANLTELFHAVRRIVQDSLFDADHDRINILNNALLYTYDPWKSWTDCQYVDINADLFALIFFCCLRREAFEDVYLEATDRCPFFLSQPDQAAVFSELWALGSQCQSYFGILPRDFGEIVYSRYRLYLQDHPPPKGSWEGKATMTVYMKAEVGTTLEGVDDKEMRQHGLGLKNRSYHLKELFLKFGALSIFCFPAIIDVTLLTFLGRGLFMTAFMQEDGVLEPACYAVLISLLVSAGVTGWVGSVGNYYLYNYAYDNMIYFHVQRLSGGFILTAVVGIVGLGIFLLKRSVTIAFVFLAYMFVVATYLNIIGVMATMHHPGSPLTSGRTVLWRTIPVLLLSPIISTIWSGHDIQIYLPVSYGFLIAILFQYRRLCHEWSTWTTKIPKITEQDVLDWYLSRTAHQISGIGRDPAVSNPNPSPDALKKAALVAFRSAVESYSPEFRRKSGTTSDPIVARVVKGLPYIEWLLQKDDNNRARAEMFSIPWFSQLNQALQNQKQMAQGLKEHNIFILFRHSQFDISLNVGLFLICLMDRWVSIVMSARYPQIELFSKKASRYVVCFAVLYFCASVMILDGSLQRYWKETSELSDEKVASFDHAKKVAHDWEIKRRYKYISALVKLLRRLLFVFGCCTTCIWILVDSEELIVLYYAYVIGYSAVVIFQFNRCFTTNLIFHNASVLLSAAVGFITGCVLHTIIQGSGFMYTDVISLNAAAVTAALLTSIWAWKDFSSQVIKDDVTTNSAKTKCWKQPRLLHSRVPESVSDGIEWRSLPGKRLSSETPGSLSGKIADILQISTQKPNKYAREVPWAKDLFRVALDLWLGSRITIYLALLSDFEKNGIHDAASFARFDGQVLEITVGFNSTAEMGLQSSPKFISQRLTECILYHCSIAMMKRNKSGAILAEHLIMDTGTLSRRIELELSTGSLSSLFSLQRNTNVRLMRHLCLEVDVDSMWSELPVVVREAIICRILGRPMSVSPEFSEWMALKTVDLYTSDFLLKLGLTIHQATTQRKHGVKNVIDPTDESPYNIAPAELYCAPVIPTKRGYNFIWRAFNICFSIPVGFTKWVAIITGGGSDVERELFYSLRHTFGRGVLISIILSLWKLCKLAKNMWVYVFLIYHRKTLAKLSRLAKKGASRTLCKNSIVVELPRKVITGISSRNDQGLLILEIFKGPVTEQPPREKPVSLATYDDQLRLVSRQESSENGTTFSTFEYSDGQHTRWPCSKEVVDGTNRRHCVYDTHGRVYQGAIWFGTKQYNFQYFYKASPHNSHEILKAEFRPAGYKRGNYLTVFWGVPLRQDISKKLDWVPSDRVWRVIRRINGRTYTTTSSYQHRYDPAMITLVEGRNVPKNTLISKPPQVFDEEQFMLQRPTDATFDTDDLLIHHSRSSVRRIHKYAGGFLSTLSILNPEVWLYWRPKVIYRRVPTWWLRTELWNNWLKTGALDAVTACWMDEFILREEPTLRRYWNLRGFGFLQAARLELDTNIEQIVAAIEIEKDVSEVCLLPIKPSDLYAMGLGNDANEVTTRPQDCINDTNERISVIFNDIGCWPEAPGGVSNCRRDLVNGHSTIRNHVLAESPNDYGIPRFQVQKSVQSLKILPLWGLDRKTPYHGVINNLLQSEVDKKIQDTNVVQDIVGTFVPLLKAFVKGARSREISRKEIITYSNTMLTMFKYFEHKDYNRTWESKEVSSAWQEAWLTPYNDPNIHEFADSFELERPSFTDFRDALNIYSSYFFIFSVQTPKNCPRVFQSTHHGISSLFGMLLKYRRGATFGIWDHAILWRECCLNISPAQSQLSIPVQYMLLSGIALATRLAYFHADIVLPCTPYFNPIWEAEIGTDRGRLGNRKQFSRKIDPIINGVSDMDSFQPVDKVRSDIPTVVMLSNVQFIKDIKTAILSADIVINKYGFKDYRLVIYGSQNREPNYAIEMAKLITQCNLGEKVKLAGFGNPQQVLKDAWLFMNSSLSEGLPLAIAEAALAGVPIVATAVGATSLVLTDPDNPNQQYGEVVPPNDPAALARAQLNLLAMLGPWASFTSDFDNDDRHRSRAHLTLPEVICEDDVEWVTKRMYEKADDRRKLGLLSRQTVLRGFHGKRYLREHEQMYWIQWHWSRMRADPDLATSFKSSLRFGTPEPLRYTESSSIDSGTKTGTETDTEATSELEKPPLVGDGPYRSSRDTRRSS